MTFFHGSVILPRLVVLRKIFVSGTLIVIRLTDLYDFICREQKSLTT